MIKSALLNFNNADSLVLSVKFLHPFPTLLCGNHNYAGDADQTQTE